MERQLRSILESHSASRPDSREYLPVQITSQQYQAISKSVADREAAPIDPAMLHRDIDFLIDQIILECVNGNFSSAEMKVFRAYRRNIAECAKSMRTFMQFLDAFCIVQRLDIVRDLIKAQYLVPFPFDLLIDMNGPGFARVRWDISPDGHHLFTFDVDILGTRSPMRIFCDEFPLILNYAMSAPKEHGSITINHWDTGLTPGLAYSDSRPDYFLVPDYTFVSTKGYDYERRHFQQDFVKWGDRKPVAFWRGSTSGGCEPGRWRDLERIKLCEIAQRNDDTGFFDVGISGIVQIDDIVSIKEIEESGFIRDVVPWKKWNNYKYHIDIDGNANAWSSLFQKLFTGSPVLKVASYRGFRQWFYDDLVPWHNYVPVASSMWDLLDKIKWLRANDATAQKIGERGRELAEKLSFSRELARSVSSISRAFRYFNDNKEIFEDNREFLLNEYISFESSLVVCDQDIDIIYNLFLKNGFDLEQYIVLNPDLGKLDKDLRSVAAHLVFHGFAEGRDIPLREIKSISSDIMKLNLSPHLKTLIILNMKKFKKYPI